MRMLRGVTALDFRQAVLSKACKHQLPATQWLSLSWLCFAAWGSQPARKARWSAACGLGLRLGIPTQRKLLGAFQRPLGRPAATMKLRPVPGARRSRRINVGKIVGKA